MAQLCGAWTCSPCLPRRLHLVWHLVSLWQVPEERAGLRAPHLLLSTHHLNRVCDGCCTQPAPASALSRLGTGPAVSEGAAVSCLCELFLPCKAPGGWFMPVEQHLMLVSPAPGVWGRSVEDPSLLILVLRASPKFCKWCSGAPSLCHALNCNLQPRNLGPCSALGTDLMACWSAVLPAARASSVGPCIPRTFGFAPHSRWNVFC